MHEDAFLSEMKQAGYPVSVWSNGPGDGYGEHSHGYRKILFCLEGSIVFHTGDGDLELREGDRMTLEAGVVHAATVGATGVRCAEAHVG